MTPERWAQIEELFHRACACEPKDREVLFNEACRGDPDLRREVQALLAGEENAGEHLNAAIREELKTVGFPLAGETVSHYRILDGLAGGGMGLVYRAEDIKLGRRVALKFLPEDSAKDVGALGRFEREARAASALEHPNICPIYEFGEHQGQPFLVMQLLEGQTLCELIAANPGKPPCTITNLLDLAIQITEGLEAAHDRGIIHRDIKPANIFVTTQGQAKILDFGLAKLASLTRSSGKQSAQPNGNDDQAALQTTGKTGSSAATDISISLTGVAMGTAGYMSPEQVRGEQLDARSDLFSFGVVLYEMATGKRAFTGDTGPVLQNAILTQTPTSVSKLNPKIPAPFERIVNKALEKDRGARYQTTAELRADLESVKQAMQPRQNVAWLALASGAFIASVAMMIFWFARHKQTGVEPLPNPKLRQLTVNSFENSVVSGVISPDGKYLAYTNGKRIYIRVLETRETRSVPQPAEFNDKELEWEIDAAFWFPDSTRFIVDAHPSLERYGELSSKGASIWAASVSGEAPRKLRDEAFGYAISPDGSLICFGQNKGKYGDREIWLMRPDGEQPRKLYETGEDSATDVYGWSPDGQRLVYGKTDSSGYTVGTRDLKQGPPITLFTPSEMERINKDFTWLPDGRLLYPVMETGTAGKTCNYWAMRLDARTGEPIQKPKQLTNWTGFCMGSTSVTADGKEVVFLRWEGHMISHLSELEAGGTRIGKPRHFPLSESSDAVTDWTPDSKTVILVSNRSGHYEIYKQSLDEETADPLVTQGYGRDSHVSPDGNSVIYLGVGERGPWPAKGPEPVMRVPIAGGTPQRLFIAGPKSLLTCARSPSDLCVIGEPTKNDEELAASTFDSINGRGKELFRVALGSNDTWRLNLSPDGTRFAFIPSATGPISILSVRGEELQKFPVKGWSHLQSVVWAADGKSLFVTADIQGGTVVLHVDLRGSAHVLWENAGASWETLAHPSPDGRYLEFDDWTTSGNMWLMENF